MPWPLLPAPLLLLLTPLPDCVPVGVGGGCERKRLGSRRCGFGGWVLLLLLPLLLLLLSANMSCWLIVAVQKWLWWCILQVCLFYSGAVGI